MKKLIILIVTVLIAATVICCKLDMPVKPLMAHQLETTVILLGGERLPTTQNAYPSGEEITMEFSYRNTLEETFLMEPFPPQISIMPVVDTNGGLITFSPVRRFPAGTETRSIDPSETATYSLTWDQLDDSGQPVLCGYYKANLGNIRVDEETYALYSLEIPSFLIQPPGGSMERRLEDLSLSQTTGGIEITIDAIDIERYGTQIYGHISRADFIPGEDSDLEVAAEYSIDGTAMPGPVKALTLPFDEESPLVWGLLNPVPRDAKEIILTVSEIIIDDERWEPYLEYHISLQ